MNIMLVIYLIALGLCSWFGPTLVAVTNKDDAEAKVTDRDAFAGIIMGLIPVLNIFMVFFGASLLSDIIRVNKEAKRGNREPLRQLNRDLSTVRLKRGRKK